jgi:hypothetical protein
MTTEIVWQSAEKDLSAILQSLALQTQQEKCYAPPAQIDHGELYSPAEYHEATIDFVVSTMQFLDSSKIEYDVTLLFYFCTSLNKSSQRLEYEDVLCILQLYLESGDLEERSSDPLTFADYFCPTAAEEPLIYS